MRLTTRLTLMVAAMTMLSAVALKAEDGRPQSYVVKSGTRVPLVLVNSINTKNSHEGDQIYLQSSFPIAVNGRIVIPQGSYVTGTLTQVKRPGRIKGRGEIYLRFDSLMLPNGVQRDFRGTVSGVDADRDAKLKGGDSKNKEGKIEGDSTKGQDVGTVASTTAQGAGIGGVIGASKGSPGKGIGMGAGIGAAAGLGIALLTRGPDIRLPRGSSIEMLLDRDLQFGSEEVMFLGSAPPPAIPQVSTEENGPRRNDGWGGLPRPF